ncbi:MAG: hypothetical protein DWP94_03465 [Flavobacterium sp.]|nr:MAG: hypothetical protein DWP94_03465 [Flavobacterium sp.]
MLRKLVLLGLLIISLSYVSCDLAAQKADKRISATLKLVTDNPSEKEYQQAIIALKDRFRKLGNPIKEIKLVSEEKIIVEIETSGEVEAVQKFLTTSARLEFFSSYKTEEMMPFVRAANTLLANTDSREKNPLLSKINMPNFDYGAEMFHVQVTDTAEIFQYLSIPEVRALLEMGKEDTKFLPGKLIPETDMVSFYALDNERGVAPLDGTYVTEASMSYDQVGRPTINIVVNPEGAKIWAQMTETAFIQGSQIAIVIDDVVYSAPGVVAGPITGGRSQIAGDFTEAEAQELALLITSGAIPKMKLLEISSEPIN